MTQRWRKKLQGLDGVGPDDQVFERAKAGPQLPDDAIPGPKTSTRIVTVIAAFLVFALAISVFAIPALRLKDDGTTPIQGAGAGIQPLWPWRTLDDVKAFAADPQPFTTGVDPDVAFSPEKLASTFGTQVLGWGDKVWANEVGGAAYTDCVTWGGDMSSTPSAPYLGAPCSLAAPTAPASAFRTYDLNTCGPQDEQMQTICEYAYPGPGGASVVVYQPLGADGPWAVIEAKSQYLDLSAGAGDVVHDGSPLSVVASIPDGYHGALATHIGTGEGSCDVTAITSVFDKIGDPGIGGEFVPSAAKMAVSYSSSVPGGTCPPAEPSYVFGGIAEEPLVGDGSVFDPLAHGGSRLFAFAAVPIVAMSGDTGATEAPPPTAITASPTESAIPPVEWTTYTDKLGWTIDVPKSWKSDSFDAFDGRVTNTGAWFSSAEPQVIPGDAQEPIQPVAAPGEVIVKIWHREGGAYQVPTDDSTFPLSYGSELTFQGDGLAFTLSITSGDGTFTAAQEEILRRMVGSIHFESWTKGETRNGLTAFGPADHLVSGAVAVDGTQLLVHAPGGFYLLELGVCPSSLDVTLGDGGQISVTCGGTTGIWTGMGMPDGQNPPGFDQPLPAHPGYLGWDGSVLVAFGTTLGADEASVYWPA